MDGALHSGGTILTKPEHFFKLAASVLLLSGNSLCFAARNLIQSLNVAHHRWSSNVSIAVLFGYPSNSVRYYNPEIYILNCFHATSECFF